VWRVVWGAALLGALGFVLSNVYGRWRQLTERERFFLSLKEAAIPKNLRPDESARLRLLRSPWWGLSRWLPDLWRRRS